MGPVLVTGAFGNLGRAVLDELFGRGVRVIATDRATPENTAVAADLPPSARAILGDLSELDLDAALEGAAGVIHLAAVLPPASDWRPERARRLNVDATLRLITAVEKSAPDAPFVFPSSLTVFGPPSDPARLHRADDPVRATDPYTEHKLAIEDALRRSALRHAILRVGVSVDARTLRTDLITLHRLFRTRPDHPLHWVHPRDVAFALAEALVCEQAHGRVLLIGGDASCRVTMGRLLGVAPAAFGLSLPRYLFGRRSYPTCWLDTEESQRLLRYQRRNFGWYEAEVRDRVRGIL